MRLSVKTLSFNMVIFYYLSNLIIFFFTTLLIRKPPNGFIIYRAHPFAAPSAKRTALLAFIHFRSAFAAETIPGTSWSFLSIFLFKYLVFAGRMDNSKLSSLLSAALTPLVVITAVAATTANMPQRLSCVDFRGWLDIWDQGCQYYVIDVCGGSKILGKRLGWLVRFTQRSC